MGVAGLAVLGMSATLAGAQTVEVKEKRPLYRHVSYWTFPRAHCAYVDKENAESGAVSIYFAMTICRAIRASHLEA
jgi:hypothetical protein